MPNTMPPARAKTRRVCKHLLKPKCCVKKTDIPLGSDYTGLDPGIMILKKLGLQDRARPMYGSDSAAYVRAFLKHNYKYENGLFKSIQSRPPMKPNVITFYAAGFECQPFSLMGLQQGEKDKSGRGLGALEVTIKIAQERPEIFVLENVRAFATMNKHKELFRKMMADLRKLRDHIGKPQYHIEHKVLNTKDYGIPHSRRRVYIIGFKVSSQVAPFSWPRPTPPRPTASEFLDKDDPKLVRQRVFPTAFRALERLTSGLKILKKQKIDFKRRTIFIDIDGGPKRPVDYKEGVCMCLTRNRCAAGGWWISNRMRRMTTQEMLKFQGIQLPSEAYHNVEGLTRRQFQMMIGNSWSLNVASKITYRLFLATGVATKQQMRAP